VVGVGSAVGRGDSRAGSWRVPRFGEGDLPRAHPAQHGVGRNGGRKIVIGPRRKCAELLPILGPNPAGLGAARLLHGAKLLEERGAVGLTVGWRVGLAADDEPEFALLEVDGSCAWLRLPSAGTARWGDHHRLAGRTLMQPRCL